MKFLAIDPSGNFFEGKGVTGWALYYDNKPKSVGQIRSVEYSSQMEYWTEHLNLIELLSPEFIVLEEYKLYAHTASAQIGSSFETVQLIGVLKYYCAIHNIPIVLQSAKIKTRFNNVVLVHKNIITTDSKNNYYVLGIQTTNHILDAVRHAEYFINFTSKKEGIPNE